jgi:hypothetical protein
MSKGVGNMGSRIHTFATPYLVLVATCRRSDANLARIAAVTLSNDAEAAYNSGVNCRHQGVFFDRGNDRHLYSQIFVFGQHPPFWRHVVWNAVH